MRRSPLLLAALAAACSSSPDLHDDVAPLTPVPPRNVILFIGDGMGPAYITLARECADRPLFLDELVSGIASTHSADSRVTDSAASE